MYFVTVAHSESDSEDKSIPNVKDFFCFSFSGLDDLSAPNDDDTRAAEDEAPSTKDDFLFLDVRVASGA